MTDDSIEPSIDRPLKRKNRIRIDFFVYQKCSSQKDDFCSASVLI